MKYMATGDMLYSNVQARKMDDATALYNLANALSIADLEYSATHPAPAFRSFTCHNFDYSMNKLLLAAIALGLWANAATT